MSEKPLYECGVVILGGTAGVGVAIGISLAHNRIGDGTTAGVGAVTARRGPRRVRPSFDSLEEI